MKTGKLQLSLGSAAAAVALVLTGCTCICPKNEKAGLPIITCQPEDVQVDPGSNATFEVTAKGDNLSYQWFIQTDVGEYAVPNGGQTNRLDVPAGTTNRVGLYRCLINSETTKGVTQTSTRQAQLVETQTIKGNNPLPPQQGLLRPSTSGSSTCCSPVCGFINFNNNGAGFTLTQGKTFTMTLTKDSAGQIVVGTSQYCAQWRYGGQANQAGCCTNLSATQAQFTAPAAATYALTVYIKTGCPPSGTAYYLWPVY